MSTCTLEPCIATLNAGSVRRLVGRQALHFEKEGKHARTLPGRIKRVPPPL
jgi:hypothetical protein